MLVFSFDLLKYGNPGGRQKTFGRWLSSAVAVVVNMILVWCGAVVSFGFVLRPWLTFFFFAVHDGRPDVQVADAHSVAFLNGERNYEIV